MSLRGCWSCGSHTACTSDCDCAKCVDPSGYVEWRQEDPEAYGDWLDRQRFDSDEDCDCPSCEI
jgi:hypothetical protein